MGTDNTSELKEKIEHLFSRFQSNKIEKEILQGELLLIFKKHYSGRVPLKRVIDRSLLFTDKTYPSFVKSFYWRIVKDCDFPETIELRNLLREEYFDILKNIENINEDAKEEIYHALATPEEIEENDLFSSIVARDLLISFYNMLDGNKDKTDEPVRDVRELEALEYEYFIKYGKLPLESQSDKEQQEPMEDTNE